MRKLIIFTLFSAVVHVVHSATLSDIEQEAYKCHLEARKGVPYMGKLRDSNKRKKADCYMKTAEQISKIELSNPMIINRIESKYKEFYGALDGWERGSKSTDSRAYFSKIKKNISSQMQSFNKTYLAKNEASPNKVFVSKNGVNYFRLSYVDGNRLEKIT